MRAAELPRRLQSFSEMVSTLERLAKQTAVHRCVADADRLALTDNPATEEHYTSYLVRTYGFQAPLESALSIVPGLSAHLDLSRRVWSGVLASDLVALGYPPAQVKTERFGPTGG